MIVRGQVIWHKWEEAKKSGKNWDNKELKRKKRNAHLAQK